MQLAAKETLRCADIVEEMFVNLHEAYFPPRQAAPQVPSKLFPYAIFTSPLISSDNIPILAIPHST